jgi:hypothetical protein
MWPWRHSVCQDQCWNTEWTFGYPFFMQKMSSSQPIDLLIVDDDAEFRETRLRGAIRGNG